MSILKIARMGHPVLRTPAVPVQTPVSPQVARLVADMIDTLEDAGGVGLAAPQVHHGLRLVIYFVPPERDPQPDGAPGAGVPLTVLLNPRITPLGEETATQVEACLSLPDLAGAVPRARRIRVEAVDMQGQPLTFEASGFHARVIQHECDHLDGVLYPMRMADLSSFGFVEELRKPAPPSVPKEHAP